MIDATPRQLPTRVNHHSTPHLRDVRGWLPSSGPHGVELLEWLIGKTAYTTLTTLGEFDAILRFLTPKQLTGLWLRRVVDHHGFKLRYFGDRQDAWISVRHGNRYGILINAHRLLGARDCPEAIETGISKALHLFGRNSLPYGDFRSPGNVAALIMSEYAGQSHLPPAEHQQFHWNAFRGARFEVTTLGSIPDCYDYDISSAYPSHMAELPNTLPIEWSWTNDIERIRNADYAAVLADCVAGDTFGRSPLAVRCGNASLFWPVRNLSAVWMSRPEFAAVGEPGFIQNCRVRQASIGQRIRTGISTPFDQIVRKLYRLRQSEFGSYVKSVMVAMYGKLAGEYEGIANSHWNPVYASHITASLRMQTWRMSEGATVYGEFADGVATAEPLPTSPGIGGVREEGHGPMLLVTDVFKQSDWKAPFANLRGHMEEQREAQTVTIPVRRTVGLGSVSQGYAAPSEIGETHTRMFEFPIGSTTRVCDVAGLQNYDLLDGMIETRAPTMADIPGLMLARQIKQARIWDEFIGY